MSDVCSTNYILLDIKMSDMLSTHMLLREMSI